MTGPLVGRLFRVRNVELSLFEGRLFLARAVGPGGEEGGGVGGFGGTGSGSDVEGEGVELVGVEGEQLIHLPLWNLRR
jgi:hypothetical protein